MVLRKWKIGVFIIAHPDDEVMFFFPSLLGLPCEEIQIVSLSDGGYCGLGEKRKNELNNAAKVYGAKVVEIISDSRLRDDPDIQWDSNIVADTVLKCLDRITIVNTQETLMSVDDDIAVISFDPRGASRHAHHIAVYKGVHQAFQRQNRLLSRQNFFLYELRTPSFPWRFLGPVHAFFGIFHRRYAREYLFFTNFNLIKAWQAMTCHESQFVWYRKLGLIFSAFTYSNCLYLASVSVRNEILTHDSK